MKAFALLPLFLLPLMAQTICPSTPAYSPCDLVFDLTDQEMAAHPNPYVSVTLQAEFRSPHYHTVMMPGFWDGGHRMIVRFAPTEAGQWIFRVSSNIAQFEGKEGNVTATASDSPGFIMARNVHHWSYTEGNKPHLWMGDTCYPFASIDSALFEKLVDGRAQQKFTHLRGVVGGPAAFSGPDRPSPEFFRGLDARIQYMNRKGMIADLVLGGPGNQLANLLPEREQRERYIRYMVARYAPMNITWQGVQDFETYANARALLKDIGQMLAKLDPYKHPRSTDTMYTSTPLVSDGWMTYIAVESPDAQLGAIEHQLYPAPFVNAGFGYEDSGAGKKGPRDVATDAFRHALWNAAINGQYVTFGNTGTAGVEFPVDAKYLDSPGARQMTVWFDFWARTRHWELEPYFNVDGGRGIALAGGGEGLGGEKTESPDEEEHQAVEYIVYVEKPQKVEVLVEKHKYDVAWLNPLTGQLVKEKDFKGDHYIGAPPDTDHDWVLHISREGMKDGMLRSYKFESRAVAMQDVETNPQKLPFQIVEPSTDPLSISNPPKYAVKLTKETRAMRQMMYLWTGDVPADEQGFRVLGTGPSGTFQFPPGTATILPAVLNVHVTALNANGKAYTTDKAYQLVK